jgi:hypothetical protein
MAQTCSKCSRINPADAAYCYFDGNVLAGHARAGAPVAGGNQPFHNPFTFPSGRGCRNYDELAIACQSEWDAAKELLQQGYLEGFLGGLGRSDLALAAREAARFPDRDRGLDQFLAKLPSNALTPPKLRLDPQEVNLGTVKVGDDQHFDLNLENQGMRLLYGSVSSDGCPWLTVGEGAGAPEKLFQFGGHSTIPVHVRGKQLRAGNKPLEGRLVVESNGGTFTIHVRLEVPVKPFKDGVLAGAKSPRQVAEKAKANPKEAAPLFEKGVVARWYEENGWTYPVQGPSASGLGAVQQFFEALGLTPPPKTEISDRSVTMSGNPGETIKYALTVSTQEKRPVYAHGSSDQPWLEVGRAKLNGRTAVIPLVVPTVPNKPAAILHAKVTVVSNGNQRFVVPVTLNVAGVFAFGEPEAVEEVVEEVVEVVPEKPPEKVPSAAVVALPEVDLEPLAVATPLSRLRRPPSKGITPGHLLPACLLVLALLIILVFDLINPSKADNSGRMTSGPGPVVSPSSNKGYDKDVDLDPIIWPEFLSEKMRFGLVLPKERDPRIPGKYKRLTYEENGTTNNTVVRLDGVEHLFGQKPGVWDKKHRDRTDLPRADLIKAKGRYRWSGTMEYTEGINVTQTVEIVPNQQTRKLDTCLVRYTVENVRSNLPRKVGLRAMIDTFIGANDGVPFRIPGQKDFVDTMKVLPQKEIPEHIEAWEHADLKNPGTIAHLGLKLDMPGVNLEPLTQVVICRFPGNSEIRDWEWQFKAMNDPPDEPKDSCVVLYWDDVLMQPKERREMAYTYGLNSIASFSEPVSVPGGATQLGLSVSGSFRPGGTFTLTATVANPVQGQQVKLDLPAGVRLVEGQAEQTIEKAGGQAQKTWGLRADAVGTYPLTVTSGGAKAVYNVKISNKSIFD